MLRRKNVYLADMVRRTGVSVLLGDLVVVTPPNDGRHLRGRGRIIQEGETIKTEAVRKAIKLNVSDLVLSITKL